MAGNDTESGDDEGKEAEEEEDDVSLQSRCPYLHLVRLQPVPLHEVHCDLHDLPGRGKCLPPRPVQEDRVDQLELPVLMVLVPV